MRTPRSRTTGPSLMDARRVGDPGRLRALSPPEVHPREPWAGPTPRQLLVPGPSPEAGARSPYPTPSLETGRGRAPQQEVWQQPWGKEPGPASVTRFLRDLAPRPGSGPALRLGRGTWARDPAEVGVRPTCPASEASRYRPPPAMVQPAVPTGDLGGRQFGNDSISPAEGSGSWSPWQHAGVRTRLGGGAVPGVSPSTPI